MTNDGDDDGPDRRSGPAGDREPTIAQDDPVMDWALAERLGGAEPPDLLAGVQARLAAQPAPRTRTANWLTAATVLLAASVVVGFAVWARTQLAVEPTPTHAVEPEQDPAEEPAVVFVHDVASAKALPNDTRAVEVVGGDDDVIAALAPLRELQRLRVREPWNETVGLGQKLVAPEVPPHVTAASWPVLLGFPKLRRLELSGTVRLGRLDPAQRTAFAAALETLPLLTSLTMRCMDTDDQLLALLPRARWLRELDLSFNHGFVDDGVVALLACRTIRRLSLRGCQQLDDGVLARLAELPELEQLDLSSIDGINWRNGTEAEDDIDRALRVPDRRRADRIGMGPGHATLTALAAASRLRSLDVGGGHWRSAQLALLGGANAAGGGSLRVLRAFGGQVDGVDFVAGLPRGLESLELCGDYPDALLAAIAEHLPGLQRLTLAACDRITDRGIASLATMPKLRALDLRQMRGLTAASLDTLVGMTGLEELDLRHGPLGEVVTRERLRSLPRLRVLDGQPLSTTPR